jgi:hypothetical protein
MIDFIGKYTWEELCREWTLRAGAAKEIPYLPDKVGSAWNPRAQVDVVGMNSMEKTLILGECKWTTSANDRKAISSLVEQKAAQIVPTRGKWKVFFLGFSRSGWTSGAHTYQNQVNQEPIAGPNWVSTGMRLVELSEVDQELASWTA